MFLKMRPQIGETTVAYAARQREKAHDCDFGTNQIERILAHLIQTIENQTLPDPVERGLNVYEKLQKKLNDYFIPKRNKHYSRYMFLKMRPQIGETTVAYAARQREKAHDCDFGTNQIERILAHLIQTIENQTLFKQVYQMPGL